MHHKLPLRNPSECLAFLPLWALELQEMRAVGRMPRFCRSSPRRLMELGDAAAGCTIIVLLVSSSPQLVLLLLTHSWLPYSSCEL